MMTLAPRPSPRWRSTNGTATLKRSGSLTLRSAVKVMPEGSAIVGPEINLSCHHVAQAGSVGQPTAVFRIVHRRSLDRVDRPSNANRRPIMSTAAAFKDVHRDAEYFEYSKAADPIGLKLIARVPYRNFPASLYKHGPTRIIPLDLSKELGVDYPATGPSLLAHFVRVVGGEKQSLNPVATSQLLYALAGRGTVTQDPHEIAFSAGAFVALPGGIAATVRAETDSVLYYVNDAPLLSYLGVGNVRPRFAPTLYPAGEAAAKLTE